jgi:hypothetical protein
MTLVALAFSVLFVVVGVSVTRERDRPTEDARTSGTTATATISDLATQSGAARPTTPVRATATAPVGAVATGTPLATDSLAQLPVVAKPEPVSPTNGLARVREYYSEAHPIGNFTVRWRPGAFPSEFAEQVAGQAQLALQRANELLGTNDYAPIEIFLADQLFSTECLGCQGFAAADLRQVFILQDGSVASDELPSLLVHEIAHVLALDIADPDGRLFYAEGLAVWVSEQDITDAGYVSAIQSAAWAYRVGILPSLADLRKATYQGRMRARIEYDAAASFSAYVIEAYGMERYRELYGWGAPVNTLGKDWDVLETEWHVYLEQSAGNVVKGVDAQQWWTAAEGVIAGFTRVYDDPAPVTAEQWAALSVARLELNRCNVELATALAAASGLTTVTAN